MDIDVGGRGGGERKRAEGGRTIDFILGFV
jgi:hypothetical protein